MVTDRDGEAVFELDGPRRDHRLDVVTFEPDCQDCKSVIVEIAWSEGDPVLTTARPQFDLYVRRSSSFGVSIPVEYGLYDQYGDSVTSILDTRTGRAGTTLKGQLVYALHSVRAIDDNGAGTVTDIDTKRRPHWRSGGNEVQPWTIPEKRNCGSWSRLSKRRQGSS